MTPSARLRDIIRPGLAHLHSLGGPAPTRDAERFLLAVSLQEDPAARRYQVLDGGRKGAASGLWQFEAGGGVRGVLHHPASKKLAARLCVTRGVCGACPDRVWSALERDDVLATGFARLLLLTDQHPIPTAIRAAWECYADRLWRPGKPHIETWPESWSAAYEAVNAP